MIVFNLLQMKNFARKILFHSKLNFLLGFLLLSLPACDSEFFKNSENHNKLKRYVGNNQYKSPVSNAFIVGERVFFEIPVFDLLIPDRNKQYSFEYTFMIDYGEKTIYQLSNRIEGRKKNEFPDAPYLKFFYDTSQKHETGEYQFMIKVVDLNSGNEGFWENTFELVKIKKKR